MMGPFTSPPPASASKDLISANCCFSYECIDLSSMLSLMGIKEDQDAEIFREDEIYTPSHPTRRDKNQSQPLNTDKSNANGNIKQKNSSKYQSRGAGLRRIRMSMSSSKGSDDHPPPVIALSRSSGSTGSTSSAESALETTEVDRHHDDQYDHGHGHGHGHKKKRHMRQRRYKKYHDETAYAIPNPSSQNHDQNHPEDDCNEQDHNGVDYAVRHELLINALFEDARHRQELQAAGGTSPLTPTSPTSHTMATTPPRKNSVASVSKSITSTTRSTTSRRSNTSSGSNSDILCPSAHQFKKTLTSKRKIKITALSALKRKRKCNRNRANSFSSISKTGSNRNRASSFSSTSKMSSGKPPLDESSIASLTTGVGDHAQSFLHSQCLLQKDSGKGVDPGTGVNAHGREDAMAKLVEKMDLLGQVATDSESGAEKQFGTVNLTRVPAKNMTLARREVLFDKGTGVGVGESYADSERGFVETRSMLAVKMDKFGFMSMKYGFLVHWNKATGLAELIVLRKMCSDSFMKVKSTKKSKSWRKRMRRMSISADAEMLHMRGTTPSMISVDLTLSNDTSYDDLKAVQTDPY